VKGRLAANDRSDAATRTVPSAASIISAGDGQLSPSLASRFNERQPDRRRCNSDAMGNLIGPTIGAPQPKHIAHWAQRHPLCWHPLPRAKA